MLNPSFHAMLTDCWSCECSRMPSRMLYTRLHAPWYDGSASLAEERPLRRTEVAGYGGGATAGASGGEMTGRAGGSGIADDASTTGSGS